MNSYIKKILKKCKASPQFFIENFCKVEHPLAGVLPFRLFEYQNKILSDFETYRFSIFKKTRQCFVGDSPVMTPRGPVPIRDIEPGDEVYSLNKVTGLLEVTTVDARHNNGISQNLVEVRTKSGHRSVCTKDHKFLTDRGWVEAGNLTNEDIIVEVNEPERYGNTSDYSDQIMLGYMLTDGSCGDTNAYFANSRWKYLLEFKKHAESRIGADFSLKKVKSGFKNDSGKNYRVSSSSKAFKDWLYEFGIGGCHGIDKKIPEKVFEWDNKSIAVMLNRMFAGDGWYSSGSGNTNEAGIGQESIHVLYQIKQLLSRFKIDCKIYGATDNSIPKLRIIGGDDFKLFVENIGIFGKDVRNPITRGFLFNRIKGSIKSVRDIDKSETVYDLSVAPYHNYIVDGAVVHNCGISTLTGAYALWYAMFHTHKKVLVVSKRDLDAKEFLRKNVKFVFNNLPEWMKEIFHSADNAFNEHKVEFRSGSSITSLTSHPETLRSNSASIVIIDEAAFMQHMDKMWAAGWPTMQHGGRAIVISTTSGVGNWYWATWTDAEAGTNEFHPIKVDWWDMNWEIPIKDDDGNTINVIAPTKDMVKCKTPEKKEKYGPYWSPWLEEQYRALQKKGDDSKFRQEVLAQFVGTGQTVLSGAVLRYLGEQIEENKGKEGWEYKVMDEPLVYVDEMTGENYTLDFKKEFWIFDEPREDHEYSVGFDLSGGENKDYSAMVVWDMTTRRQVAELNIKNEPKYTARMAVWIANYYNNAVLVIDRTGLGLPIVQMVEHEIGYTNLWKYKKNPTDKGKTGLPISPSTKPILNRVLRDNFGLDGWDVVSPRLYKQLLIYINLGGGRTGNETGPGNRDDIVMAAALGLLAAVDPTTPRSGLVLPFRTENLSLSKPEDEAPKSFNKTLMPMIGSQFDDSNKRGLDKLTVEQEIMKFAGQLGGMRRRLDESVEEYKERVRSESKNSMPATVHKGNDPASAAGSVSKTINLSSPKKKNVTKVDKRRSYKSVTVKRKHTL